MPAHPNRPVNRARRRLVGAAASAAAAAIVPATIFAAAPSVRLGGVDYHLRWSKAGQHEFTPDGQADLTAWTDMLTLNLNPGVRDGEALADLANRVLGNYQRHGRILATRSVSGAQREAEHLIVAVLGTPALLEAAFARIQLEGSSGLVVVASHRVYGEKAGPAMGEWLRAHGQLREHALMEPRGWPVLARLGRG